MTTSTPLPPSEVFDQFLSASTFKSVLSTFRQLCELLHLKPTNINNFYPQLKAKLNSWRAASLWAKLDKRASHKCYNRGKACPNTRVLIIGAGPCGLRAAIESQLLGAKVVLVEKRDRFSRNNVLHLWSFVIHDLRSLGAKKFFGKFCAGSIDHISIRQLQLILLKVALLLGVEVHENVSFDGLKEPPEDQTQERIGWHACVDPPDHPVSLYEFDVLIGADGKRNTLLGFNRKEFRGKLAIAVTANFINRHTIQEAQVPEISGVAFIFNQKFFQDMREQTGIDLENIVYYKDDTHYFVMTAKKQSLLDRGVIINDYNDTARLLSAENVNRESLLDYAKDAANFATNFQHPFIEFAVNHYGQADVAMFDFTSMYAAENACRITERRGYKLLQGLVGDSLLEPFWPTGSGCARGFLSSFDAAWMIRSWASGKLTPLQVLAEREAIYRLLAQTTPENLSKDFNQYTLNPASRYPNLNLQSVLPSQVRSLYNTDGKIDEQILDMPVEIPRKKKRRGSCIHPDALLNWCQRQVALHDNIKIENFTSSWKDGLALCAILHRYRPDLIDVSILNSKDVAKNNQLAFDVCEKELGIPPVMTGQEMASCEVPDKLSMISYLAQIYDTFRGEIPVVYKSSTDDRTISPNRQSVTAPRSVFAKISNKLQNKKKYSLDRDPSKEKTDSLKRGRHPLLIHKRRSKERDKGIALDIFSRDVSLTNFKSVPEIIGAGTSLPKGSINTRAKFLEMKMQQDAGLKCHVVEDNENSRPTPLRSAHTELNIKLIQEQLQKSETSKSDKRSSCPKVGKLRKDEWNVKMLEEKTCKQVKAVPKPVANEKSKILQEIYFNKDSHVEQVAQSGGSEICYFCNKRVYLMERSSAEGLFFHRTCFKCEYCGTSLRLGNYSFDKDTVCGGKFYCQSHFRMQKPDHRWQEMMKRKQAFLSTAYDEQVKEKLYTTFLANAEKALSPNKQQKDDTAEGITVTDAPSGALLSAEDKLTVYGDDRKSPSLLQDTANTLGRDQTPERVEYENSVLDYSEEELLTSELEEEELTQKNFGPSQEFATSDDEYSNFSSDSESDEEAYAEELERSLTADETRKLAERWQQKYSIEHSLIDSEASSSADGDGLSDTEVGSEDGTSDDIDSDEEYAPENTDEDNDAEDESPEDQKPFIPDSKSGELTVEVPVIARKDTSQYIEKETSTESDISDESISSDKSSGHDSNSGTEIDSESSEPEPEQLPMPQIPTIVIEESPPQVVDQDQDWTVDSQHEISRSNDKKGTEVPACTEKDIDAEQNDVVPHDHDLLAQHEACQQFTVIMDELYNFNETSLSKTAENTVTENSRKKCDPGNVDMPDLYKQEVSNAGHAIFSSNIENLGELEKDISKSTTSELIKHETNNLSSASDDQCSPVCNIMSESYNIPSSNIPSSSCAVDKLHVKSDLGSSTIFGGGANGDGICGDGGGEPIAKPEDKSFNSASLQSSSPSEKGQFCDLPSEIPLLVKISGEAISDTNSWKETFASTKESSCVLNAKNEVDNSSFMPGKNENSDLNHYVKEECADISASTNSPEIALPDNDLPCSNQSVISLNSDLSGNVSSVTNKSTSFSNYYTSLSDSSHSIPVDLSNPFVTLRKKERKNDTETFNWDSDNSISLPWFCDNKESSLDFSSAVSPEKSIVPSVSTSNNVPYKKIASAEKSDHTVSDNLKNSFENQKQTVNHHSSSASYMNNAGLCSGAHDDSNISNNESFQEVNESSAFSGANSSSLANANAKQMNSITNTVSCPSSICEHHVPSSKTDQLTTASTITPPYVLNKKKENNLQQDETLHCDDNKNQSQQSLKSNENSAVNSHGVVTTEVIGNVPTSKHLELFAGKTEVSTSQRKAPKTLNVQPFFPPVTDAFKPLPDFCSTPSKPQEYETVTGKPAVLTPISENGVKPTFSCASNTKTEEKNESEVMEKLTYIQNDSLFSTPSHASKVMKDLHKDSLRCASSPNLSEKSSSSQSSKSSFQSSQEVEKSIESSHSLNSESNSGKSGKYRGYSGSFAEKIRLKSSIGDTIYLRSLDINLQKQQFSSLTKSSEKLYENNSGEGQVWKKTFHGSDKSLSHKNGDSIPGFRRQSSVPLDNTMHSSCGVGSTLNAMASSQKCSQPAHQKTVKLCENKGRENDPISPYTYSQNRPNSVNVFPVKVRPKCEMNLSQLSKKREHRKSVHENIQGLPFADEEKAVTPSDAPSAIDNVFDVSCHSVKTPDSSVAPVDIGSGKGGQQLQTSQTAAQEQARKEARARARLKSDEELGLSPKNYRKKYQRQLSLSSIYYEELANDEFYDHESEDIEDETISGTSHSYFFAKTVHSESDLSDVDDQVSLRLKEKSVQENTNICDSSKVTVDSSVVSKVSSPSFLTETAKTTAQSDSVNHAKNCSSDLGVKVATLSEFTQESNTEPSYLYSKNHALLPSECEEEKLKSGNKKLFFSSILNFGKSHASKERSSRSKTKDTEKEHSTSFPAELCAKTLKQKPFSKPSKSKEKLKEKHRHKSSYPFEAELLCLNDSAGGVIAEQVTQAKSTSHKTGEPKNVLTSAKQTKVIPKYTVYRNPGMQLTAVPSHISVEKKENGLAPKASEDSFSDTEEEIQRSSAANNVASPAPDADKDLKEDKMLKCQRQLELKLLFEAQEIHRRLGEIEVQQKELEQRGVEIEKALRGEGVRPGTESDHEQEWYRLVHSKSRLAREEKELLIRFKDLELVCRHSHLQQEMTRRMAESNLEKNSSQISEEGQIVLEMLKIVAERNKLLEMLNQLRSKKR